MRRPGGSRRFHAFGAAACDDEHNPISLLQALHQATGDAHGRLPDASGEVVEDDIASELHDNVWGPVEPKDRLSSHK